MDGLERREHLKVTHAGEIAVSPEARWIAFTHGANAFIAPMPATSYAEALAEIGKSGGALSPVYATVHRRRNFPVAGETPDADVRQRQSVCFL